MATPSPSSSSSSSCPVSLSAVPADDTGSSSTAPKSSSYLPASTPFDVSSSSPSSSSCPPSSSSVFISPSSSPSSSSFSSPSSLSFPNGWSSAAPPAGSRVGRLLGDLKLFQAYQTAAAWQEPQAMQQAFESFSWADAEVLRALPELLAARGPQRQRVEAAFAALLPRPVCPTDVQQTVMSLWLKARLFAYDQRHPFSLNPFAAAAALAEPRFSAAAAAGPAAASLPAAGSVPAAAGSSAAGGASAAPRAGQPRPAAAAAGD